MPVTKQAIKKVRQDRRKTIYNLRTKRAYKKTILEFRENPTAKGFSEVSSRLDKAAKTNVIHRNKASRLKSRLSKLLISHSKQTKARSK